VSFRPTSRIRNGSATSHTSTDEGWLYLAGILDLYGRESVGWAIGERMTKELVIQALKQANGRRENPKGTLIHSDRGSQYCSHDYQKELNRGGFICSMSRKGNCWDNAPMESFWGKLKQEWHFRYPGQKNREIIFLTFALSCDSIYIVGMSQ